jgi:hypothetical protein
MGMSRAGLAVAREHFGCVDGLIARFVLDF